MPKVIRNPDPIRIDEQSFREMCIAHWEQVFNVCYLNLQDVEVAKGMMQEIFKSLWERRDELEITASVERYLLRSAKFKVFEYLRNSKIRLDHAKEAALTSPRQRNGPQLHTGRKWIGLHCRKPQYRR